jgi:hypothetical protein
MTNPTDVSARATTEERAVPQVPVLRAGVPYASLDLVDVRGHRDGALLARVGQANPGILRRDLRKVRERAQALRRIPIERLFAICAEAAEHFVSGTLPLGGEDGATQSPVEYVRSLSSTSGLPHALVHKNVHKIAGVLTDMPKIVRGLMRGMDPAVLDTWFGEHDGVSVLYGPDTDALGVVLPSNSPAVNSLWLPAFAMKVPVVLKPGREEPWTPMRLIQALLRAGAPREAFGFYPTSHEGSAAILEACGRSLLFGDEKVAKSWAHDRRIEVHGPGRSKILIGEDEIENWRDHLPVLVDSVVENGGRSCINASSIFVPRHADAIATALAEEFARIQPTPPEAEDARLSAFANPAFADAIDAAVEAGLRTPGVVDVTASRRGGPRSVVVDGSRYLLPTVVRCDSIEHPLARTEFLFPFVSVLEMPQQTMVDALGPTLVLTAITRDHGLIDDLVTRRRIDRLNLGPARTSRVEWDQPHEGNLFEFLYSRRAIQRASGW